MSSHTPESGFANVASVSSERRRRSRQNAIAIGAVAIAFLALPNTISKAQAGGKPNFAQPEQIVAVTDQDIFNDDPVQAEKVAEEIKDLGANTVRFFFTYNKGMRWVNPYQPELCNAVQAAKNNDLKIIIGVRGYDENGLGYVPETNRQIRDMAQAESGILWTIASNKTATEPGGCAPDEKNLYFESENEPNYVVFNRDQSAQTPTQTIIRDSIISSTLKKDAANPNIQAQVTYIGPVLAGGNHDPAADLKAIGMAEKAQGLANPYDVIEFHPYPSATNTDPAATVNSTYLAAEPVIQQYFPSSKVLMGEYGVNTNPPLNQAGNYSTPLPAGVSESQQAQFISDFFSATACLGPDAIGGGIFNVQDDGSGNLASSGVIYAGENNTTQKSSYNRVQYVMNATKNGTLTDCNE